MTYYFAKTVETPFQEALAAVRAALGAQGFGVLTEIDVQSTMKAKIGEDFRPYVILGACNPTMAHKALQMEDKVGTMLPCNVVVQSWVKTTPKSPRSIRSPRCRRSTTWA